MKFLLLLIVVLLLAWAWWPRHDPPPVEETFIADPIKPLRKSERLQQQDYNDLLDRHRDDLDAGIDNSDG